MKKIPTLFVRDWANNPNLVTTEVTPGCEWVLAGEGVATRKLDGTCCRVKDGRLYKRREVKGRASIPEGFELVEYDANTDKAVGWVPVRSGPEDKYYNEALTSAGKLPDGTYELVGPKVQGNPEQWPSHTLVRHGHGLAGPLGPVPRTFEELKKYLAESDYEGIVFYDPDGRMVKIKGKDFGLKRGQK